jgi:hypothetical protein
MRTLLIGICLPLFFSFTGMWTGIFIASFKLPLLAATWSWIVLRTIGVHDVLQLLHLGQSGERLTHYIGFLLRALALDGDAPVECFLMQGATRTATVLWYFSGLPSWALLCRYLFSLLLNRRFPPL